MNRIVAVLFLIILFAFHSFGQKRPLSNTQLADLVYSNGKLNESYPLFVHFDKNIYTNNEKIWFSAYLSKGSDSLNKQDVLTVAVINTLQKKVYLYNKFMIQNGFCSGDIQIPDSIPPGQYQLNAHTNLVKATGEPLASFNQLIQIKRVNQQTITSTLKIVDGESTKDMLKVSLMINNLNGNEKEKPEISYTIGSGQKKVLSANKPNQYIISIPVKEVVAEAPILSTCIKYNKDLIYDNIRLPLENPRQIHVQFSPEGGAIADSLRSTVGWETTGYFGQPVSIRALLK